MNKLPNIMKRNARYRGQRESEKYLSDHQEQVYEIRQLYKEIKKDEENQSDVIEKLYKGESIPPLEEHLIYNELTFTIQDDMLVYHLMKEVYVKSYSNVKLYVDGELVPSSLYKVEYGQLIFKLRDYQPKRIANGKVTFDALIQYRPEYTKGWNSTSNRIRKLQEQVKEMERRLTENENAYI